MIPAAPLRINLKAALLAVVFLVTAGMGMVWSILAIYAEKLGASAAMVGVMVACFGGVRLIVNMPAGIASERFGRQRTILFGLAILAVGAFAATQATTFPSLLTCLLLQGIGSAAYVTAALAAFADIGTPETRIGDMSNYQAATLIGLSVGPAIGGLLAATAGYESPFLLLGGMAVLGALAMALAAVPEKDRTASAQKPAGAHGREPVPAGLVGSIIGLAAMTFGIIFTRIGVVWVLLPLFAQERFALGPREIGLMLTASAIGNLVMLPLVTMLARRQGYRFTVLLSTWITVGALVLLAVVDAVASVWIAAVLLGIGSALAIPTLSAYAANAAPPHQVGAAMGLLRTVTDVAIVIGPVAVGALLSSAGLGYLGVLVICIAILFIATIVFAVLIRPVQG